MPEPYNPAMNRVPSTAQILDLDTDNDTKNYLLREKMMIHTLFGVSILCSLVVIVLSKSVYKSIPANPRDAFLMGLIDASFLWICGIVLVVCFIKFKAMKQKFLAALNSSPSLITTS